MPALLLSMYIRNTTKEQNLCYVVRKITGIIQNNRKYRTNICCCKKQNNCLSNSKNLLYLQCDAAWGSADKILSISIELGIYEQCRKILKRSALFLYSRV